jgi:hypothetical protein
MKDQKDTEKENTIIRFRTGLKVEKTGRTKQQPLCVGGEVKGA